MVFALPFPDVSPDLFSLDLGFFVFTLRWYALAYIAGIVGGWWMARWLVTRPALWPKGQMPMTKAQVEDVMTWIVLGIVVGGRLGYVLIYQPGYYLAQPLEIVAVWQGGMAFHGGALGTAIAVTAYAWRHKIPILSILDIAAMVAPLGLGLGRIANFINAELWGRPTDMPWGVIFPGDAAQACTNVGEFCARHPSQIYQATLEGAVLLVALWWVGLRGGLKRRGLILGLFLTGYGAARTVVEAFRQADAQYITVDNPLGHVVRFTESWGLTMGQVLSLPMIAAGLLVVAVVLATTRTRT
ncbi:prolipoprotein diacylglyceryl transferase [Jannaschia seohaensis]|uniref:Phosphatidylglycerol--prolipoprotein diacylglyceryl transferase n=1 Tax=Jannaschia seohaensis TaxID=475081 RepID=A0A2Y9B2H3_9RHOB|nr:prolipoprotein diacylglyceryl transferase [Jannaschia seohaensis]PWJ14426.1 phosphatidylglycerol:prolipoprotein diacylglycerol transferase [Jannaschia seohaensis]SSA50155.1 phosphatidylglycerol:prolipoprotein diacylglycerol transferase [Jannaschia seohaensis]